MDSTPPKLHYDCVGNSLDTMWVRSDAIPLTITRPGAPEKVDADPFGSARDLHGKAWSCCLIVRLWTAYLQSHNKGFRHDVAPRNSIQLCGLFPDDGSGESSRIGRPAVE